uniref:Uncharacterized protein n=1 Tax=Rhizophora mucronata TaxID=61149 RepID=A0A2P2PWS1_RHIMU
MQNDVRYGLTKIGD